jgi:S-adenosylmethionine/arginine decarboxylase-like enzyme
MRDLVKNINMEVLAGPISLYSNMVGNRGLTSTVILNTSHAALHTWDEASPAVAMLDVYSCGKLDIDVIFEMLNQFNPETIEYKFLDRENSLEVVDFGMRTVNATSAKE